MPDQTNSRKIVRITAKTGHATATREALLELQRATWPETGCLEFQFFQSLDDDHAFLLIEDFANEEALQHHLNLPHTQAFFARELVASIKPIERGWMS